MAAATAGAKPAVLCVDDEPQVLKALALGLGRRYRILTANSGPEGLEAIARNPDIQVIVSDMRMPEMDGATFLAQANERLPTAVRILLTGYSEIGNAIKAVNEGQIFRFLTKPCAPAALSAALEAAVRQHELITAERVLLERTLQGSIRALTDVLALINPLLFGRATRVKQIAEALAAAVELPERWQVEVAALLAQLGMVTLPAELAEKVYYGTELEEGENGMLQRSPEVTDRLLAHIPRLETVRQIIAWRTRPFKRSDYIQPNRAEALACRGAQILKVALDYDAQIARGVAADVALGALHSRNDYYDPDLLQALATWQGADTRLAEVREVPLAGLKPGMTFAEEVRTTSGALLVTAGTEITAAFLERIHNYRAGTIKSPLRVVLRTADLEPALKKDQYVE